MQLGVEVRRVHLASIWSVDRSNTNAAANCANQTRLTEQVGERLVVVLRGVVGNALLHIGKAVSRCDQYAVTPARAEGDDLIRSRREEPFWNLGRIALCLLQQHDVWLRCVKPCGNPLRSGTKPVDVPGGDAKGARCHDSPRC